MAKASMEDMFGKAMLEQSIQLIIRELRSGIYLNNPEKFEFIPFPDAIQYSSTYATCTSREGENWKSYIGGNNYQVKPQFGRQDASLGWELVFNLSKSQDFKNISCTPLFLHGQIREIKEFNNEVVFGIHNDSIKVLVNTNLEYE
jgi:hypothetical protein